MNNWLIVAGDPARAYEWGNESGLSFQVASGSFDLFCATTGTNVVLLSGWQEIIQPHELRQILEDRIRADNAITVLIQFETSERFPPWWAKTRTGHGETGRRLRVRNADE